MNDLFNLSIYLIEELRSLGKFITCFLIFGLSLNVLTNKVLIKVKFFYKQLNFISASVAKGKNEFLSLKVAKLDRQNLRGRVVLLH